MCSSNQVNVNCCCCRHLVLSFYTYCLQQGHFSHVYKGEYTDDRQRTLPVMTLLLWCHCYYVIDNAYSHTINQ